MDYHNQEFRPNAGDEFLELSALSIDKQRQTQIWQENQYLSDSGIHSGLTTHAPSIISSNPGRIDSNLDYLQPANDKMHSAHSVWNQQSGYESISVISNNDVLLSPAPPSASSTNYGGGLSMDPFNDTSSLNSMPLSGINTDFKGNQIQEIDSNEVAAAIPDLIKVIRENDDPSVLYQASLMVFQLSKSEAIEALIGSDEMITEVIQSLRKIDDSDMIRFFAGTLYNISQTQKGLKAIFNANCIPSLIRLLDSTIESVLFYAITTLHNLLLHQEGAKVVVRAEGNACLRPMCALLRKNNTKFLTILTDCLQILAYGHPESKIMILQNGGPTELVRILYQYSYEKLLWTTARVLKVLSVCSMNKPTIIQVGGLDALGRHLLGSQGAPTSNRLTMNCLWTLRNLSDAAASVTNVSIVPGTLQRSSMQNLLTGLIQLLTSSDPGMVACSAGILSNLTCNNFTNKLLVCQCDGIKQFLNAVSNHPSRDDILEPCICAMRHLTARHEGEETARMIIVGRDKLNGLPLLTRVLHAATAGLCPELGLINSSQVGNTPQLQSWMLVKAMVGLIRNLAMNRDHHEPMREHGLLTGLIWLLYGTIISIFTHRRLRSTNQTIEVQNVRLEEIIEGICGALYMLMRDPQCRHHLANFQFPELRSSLFTEPASNWINSLSPSGANHALALFVHLLQPDQSESIQKASAGVLCEASKDKGVLEVLTYLIPSTQRRLNELTSVRNEAIATYCSTVLIRMAEEFSGGSIIGLRPTEQGSGPLLNTPPHPGASSNFDQSYMLSMGDSFLPNSVTTMQDSVILHQGYQQSSNFNINSNHSQITPMNYGGPMNDSYYWRAPINMNSSPGLNMETGVSSNEPGLGPYFN